MNKADQVLTALKAIIDPDLGRDIVSLGFVRNLNVDEHVGVVTFEINLTTPACPVKDDFKREAEALVRALDWVTDVSVMMTAQPRTSGVEPRGKGLAGVQHILAVSSCKGGVGKSSTAVNLAFALAKAGAKVGIFDADIYGPSLPTMVRVPHAKLYVDMNQMIYPREYQGVNLMSFAFTGSGPEDAPAMMRGPMVSQVVNQLLTQTLWGELDYLVIDFPPGTGDIQITLAQIIPMTAAVIVTTPQKLSFVDVVKGITMFDTLKIPVVAVVENMSYLACENCGARQYPFGQGALRRLIDEYGFKNTYQIPIHADVSAFSDAGTPLVLAKPDHPVSEIYRYLAGNVVREISKIRYGESSTPELSITPDQQLQVTRGGKTHLVDPVVLRLACRCARCVDEWTGAQRLLPEHVATTIHPKKAVLVGNYAVAIDWSDGHHSLYPFDTI